MPLDLMNLLMSCTISTSAHLPDVSLLLHQFLNVREDDSADKLYLEINLSCFFSHSEPGCTSTRTAPN